VIIIVVHVEVKIYVPAVKGAQAKRKDRMKLSLPPILLEKLVWVSVFKKNVAAWNLA
jgi:hypothetical protein